MKQHHYGTVTSLDLARKRKAAESIVICLACAAAYQKPAGAGTLGANPGCPTCGYVGWIGVARLTRRGAAAPRGPAPAFGQTETRASSSIEV